MTVLLSLSAGNKINPTKANNAWTVNAKTSIFQNRSWPVLFGLCLFIQILKSGTLIICQKLIHSQMLNGTKGYSVQL